MTRRDALRSALSKANEHQVNYIVFRTVSKQWTYATEEYVLGEGKNLTFADQIKIRPTFQKASLVAIDWGFHFRSGNIRKYS